MARVHKSLWLWLGLWVFLAGFAQYQINRRFEWRYPPLNTLVVSENYTTDVSALFLGAHRLAADIAYVQFLQYYGVREDASEQDGHHMDDGHGHSHADFDSGLYPRLFEYGRRIMRLDPYFNAAVLDVAGSLAFNQKRIDEALNVLHEAVALDPAFYRYRLYMAAILYRNEGQDNKLIDALAEAVRYPDAPFMLKNILANLYKKQGRFMEAARLYLEMIDTAPTALDRSNTEQKLLKLVAAHPELQAPR